jgi:hypothetical protein
VKIKRDRATEDLTIRVDAYTTSALNHLHRGHLEEAYNCLTRARFEVACGILLAKKKKARKSKR